MCCLIPARETIPRLKKEKLRQAPQDRGACRSFSYGIFGMGVDRKHEAKWLFPFRGPRGQVFVGGVEVKATFYCSRKVYVYSDNALGVCRA